MDPEVRATLRPKGGLPMRIHPQDKRFERPEVRGGIHGLVALA